MSEEEFLARWSRRKREASAKTAFPETTEPGDPSSTPPTSTTEEDDKPEFDLSSLPPIDTITAATDITVFLRKGIPQELTRAALRRAWTADPAIRDFVGLAENAWDFNDPNAMPGFGPLDCSEAELAEWVERIVGGVRNTAESLLDANPGNSEEASAPGLRPTDASGAAEVVDQSVAVSVTLTPAAAQPEVDEETEPGLNPVSARRRAHGGALPR